MSKPWRVQAREDHFAVLGANGDEMLVSVKEYETPGNARRAARNFASAMKRELIFEYDDAEGETIRETVDPGDDAEAPSQATVAERIAVVEPGKTRHASSPYAQ
jgi:hypothetical protein